MNEPVRPWLRDSSTLGWMWSVLRKFDQVLKCVASASPRRCEWRRLGQKENVSGVNETRGTPLNRRDKLKHIIDLLFRHDRLAVNSGNVIVFFVTSDQWRNECLLADKCLWFIAGWHELHVSIRLGDVYSISSFRSFLYLSHLFYMQNIFTWLFEVNCIGPYNRIFVKIMF